MCLSVSFSLHDGKELLFNIFSLISIRLLYTILLVFRNIFITSWLQFFTHFSYKTLSKFDTEFTHICEAAHTIAKVKMIRFLCFYFSPIPPDTTVNISNCMACRVTLFKSLSNVTSRINT